MKFLEENMGGLCEVSECEGLSKCGNLRVKIKGKLAQSQSQLQIKVTWNTNNIFLVNQESQHREDR